jgi:porin
MGTPAQAQSGEPPVSVPGEAVAAAPAVLGSEQGDTRARADRGAAADWLGLKPILADAGIRLASRYVSETAWNATGGKRRDLTETGEFDIGAELDMQRIVGTDGSFQATVTYRRGALLDRSAGLGTLQEVQEIFGRGHAWRLTQFWYEQRFLQGAVALKVGRTSPGEDFAAFSCSFQNLSFCGSQPGNLVTDYWYNWPVSQWGSRLRANYGGAYLQIAVYEENPRNLDNRFVLGRFSGGTGVLIPLELGLTRGADGGGPVGSYKLGGWVSTANAADVLLDVNRQPIARTGLPALRHASAHGFWINLQQQLTGHSIGGRSVSGLSVFANITMADRDTSRIDNQIAVGLFAQGIVPSMTGDELGLALARTHVNGRFARAEQFAGRAGRGSEYAVELFYGFHPLSWLDLRPNVQWIHHAGGDRYAAEVGVAGMKVIVTF